MYSIYNNNEKKVCFTKPSYSVVPCCYLLSHFSVSVYKFTVLNYLF